MLKSTVFNVDTLSFWKWKRIQCIILYTKFSKMCMFFKVSHAIETCIYIKLLFSNFYSYGAFNCVLISERDFLKIMYRKLNMKQIYIIDVIPILQIEKIDSEKLRVLSRSHMESMIEMEIQFIFSCSQVIFIRPWI